MVIQYEIIIFINIYKVNIYVQRLSYNLTINFVILIRIIIFILLYITYCILYFADIVHDK
jgi:hypothetical protein